MSAPGLVMTLLPAEGRLYLYDAGEDTASLLCARGDGSLGLSFTGEMRLPLEPAAGGAPPHLLVEWGGAEYRGPRVR